MRAPGSTIDDVLAAAAASKRQAAYQASLVSAWQRSLPHIAPRLACDTVVDVLEARPSRAVLLTSAHVAYLCVKKSGQQVGSMVGAAVWASHPSCTQCTPVHGQRDRCYCPLGPTFPQAVPHGRLR